jgi:hypothetical protein
MNTFGNYQKQEELKRILHNSASDIVIIVGKSGIGKFSFIVDALRSRINEFDLLTVDNTVDSARDVISSFITSSIYSDFKALVINDADSLSDSAQDAYLKIFEEPYGNMKVFMVCGDDSCLSEPLISRTTNRVFWSPLSKDDLYKFIESESLSVDNFAVEMCDGRPGLYREIMNNKSYEGLYNIMSNILMGTAEPMVPDIIKNSKSAVEKEIISLICSTVIRKTFTKSNHKLSLNFLAFVSDITHAPSINTEIHWQRACLV